MQGYTSPTETNYLLLTSLDTEYYIWVVSRQMQRNTKKQNASRRTRSFPINDSFVMRQLDLLWPLWPTCDGQGGLLA